MTHAASLTPAPPEPSAPAPSWSDRLLARLSRKTTSGQFILEIDGLRFVAIWAVVLFHLGGFVFAKSANTAPLAGIDRAIHRLLATGHYGVQLFFVISGFVLALPFARYYLDGHERPDLRAYYLRRLTRLEPPYVLAMTLVFFAAVIVGGRPTRELAGSLGASLLYLHNLIYGRGSTLNVVAWSLEIEVQFYLLAPLLAAILSVRHRWIRRALLVSAMTAAVFGQGAFIVDAPRLSLTLLNFIQFFLLGFLLADLFLTEWRTPTARPWLWDVAGAGGWLALVATWLTVPRPGFLFLALAFIVFAATFRGGWLRRIFRNRWVTTIGGMCYTIYLLHYPFISALGQHTLRAAGSEHYTMTVLEQGLLVLPALLAASVAYFALIERPCMSRDWPQRLWRALLSRAQRPSHYPELYPVADITLLAGDDGNTTSHRLPQ